MVTEWVKTLEALKKRLEVELPENSGKIEQNLLLWRV